MSFGYDAAGRVTTQTRPDGQSIGFDYDAAGNVTAVTPPGRPPHTFTLTPVNLLERYEPPAVDGATPTTYTYSLDREPETIARPDGQTVTAAYDAGGRLGTLTTSTGALTYTYEPASGRLSTVTAPDATLRYTYDGPLPTAEEWTGAVAGAVQWTFDGTFRVVSERVNGGTPVNFTYDADGLLSGAGTLTLTRDAANGFLTRAAVGSVVTTFGYDGFGTLGSQQTTVGGASRFEVSYTRDALGRIQQKTETVLGVTHLDAYTYDLAGRLTAVTRDGPPLVSYTYDANGNRLTETTATGTVSATYDAQDRLLTYGSATYTYTASGELRTRTSPTTGTTTYTYDALGNLTAVALPGGTLVSYLVDGANRRIGQRINGALVQGFLYQGQLRPVAELDASGTVVSRFVYATGINVPDYLIRGGATYRIVTDHLGSPRLVVNTATGAVVQQIDYDPFGRVVLDTNPGFQPFGFAGGLYDPRTGLVRFGARDYDAETGRWTTKDPIGFSGGAADLYQYGGGDPVSAVDPFGLYTFDDFLASAANFSAAFGDVISLGITNAIREAAGLNAVLSKCGMAYSLGGYAGVAFTTIAGTALGARSAAAKAWTEFSHWIPDRYLRDAPGWVRNGFGKSRLNGNYVSPSRHYLHDPFRWPTGWESMGDRFGPAVQQLDRFPRALIGAAVGAGVGAAGGATAAACGCK